MAMEILTQIKEAEEKARETRRVAAIAAKDALKLADQENSEIEDKQLTQARRSGLEAVEAAEQAAKKELDALQAKRLKECEGLKTAAKEKLSAAADVCLERILK